MSSIDISKPTGNFILLPRYAADLTKHNTEGSNLVPTPSRFITFKLGDDIKKLKEVFTSENVNSGNGDGDYQNYQNHVYEKFIQGLVGNTSSFICEINMHSYNEYNGVGYSEIYCYIDNTAKPYKYNGGNNIISDLNNINEKFSEDTSVKSAEFNYILVLYDNINSKTKHTEESNIPLGLYMTGGIEDDKFVGEIVTKFISNDEIYGNGTSYGLRICTRFVNGEAREFTFESGDNFGDTDTIAGIGELLNEFRDINKNSITRTEYLKEYLSSFKNNKTNIPYVKEVDGISYWFVNGQKVAEVECRCKRIPYKDIYDLWGEYMEPITPPQDPIELPTDLPEEDIYKMIISNEFIDEKWNDPLLSSEIVESDYVEVNGFEEISNDFINEKFKE